MNTTTPRPREDDPPPPYSAVPPPNHVISQVAQDGSATQPSVVLTPAAGDSSTQGRTSPVPEESYTAAARPVHVTRPRPQSVSGGSMSPSPSSLQNSRLSTSHSPTRPSQTSLYAGGGGGVGLGGGSIRPTWASGMPGVGRPSSATSSSLGPGRYAPSGYPGPGSSSFSAGAAAGRRATLGTQRPSTTGGSGSGSRPQEVLRVCQDFPCWKCSDTGIKPSGRACRRCNMGEAIKRIVLLGRGRNVVIHQLCWKCRGTGRIVHAPLSFRFAGIQLGMDGPQYQEMCDRCRGSGSI